VFDSLRLDAVPTHLELRVNSAEEVNTPRLDVDLALVSRAVEAAELRMGDELLGGLLRLVAIPARDVHPTDAEFANLAMRQWSELVDFEDDVGDVGKRGADVNGLPRPQSLAARVGARLRWAVGVDDLPPATGPRLHERGGKSFARRNDIAAQRIGEIQFGGWSERGQQHRWTEEHRDLGVAQYVYELRAGTNLLLGQHHHCAAGHPSAVHLRDAAVVAE